MALYKSRCFLYERTNKAPGSEEWYIETWRALPFLDGVKNEDAFVAEASEVVPELIERGFLEGESRLSGYYSVLRFTDAGLQICYSI